MELIKGVPDKTIYRTLDEILQYDLRGRTGMECEAVRLLRGSPQAIAILKEKLRWEYGIRGKTPLRYRGHGHQALVVSTNDNQIVRISPHTEPKRIHSDSVLRNHVPMFEIPLENHSWIHLEVAAFPCVKTLGETIDRNEISLETARDKFSRLNKKILSEGYHFADGVDMHSSIPRENIGVFDNGEFVVLDGGMYSAEPQNLNAGWDGSREIMSPQPSVTPPLELLPPQVSAAQLDHMQKRGLTMGKYGGGVPEKDLVAFEEKEPTLAKEFRSKLDSGQANADEIQKMGEVIERSIKIKIRPADPTSRVVG